LLASWADRHGAKRCNQCADASPNATRGAKSATCTTSPPPHVICRLTTTLPSAGYNIAPTDTVEAVRPAAGAAEHWDDHTLRRAQGASVSDFTACAVPCRVAASSFRNNSSRIGTSAALIRSCDGRITLTGITLGHLASADMGSWRADICGRKALLSEGLATCCGLY